MALKWQKVFTTIAPNYKAIHFKGVQLKCMNASKLVLARCVQELQWLNTQVICHMSYVICHIWHICHRWILLYTKYSSHEKNFHKSSCTHLYIWLTVLGYTFMRCRLVCITNSKVYITMQKNLWGKKEMHWLKVITLRIIQRHHLQIQGI